MSLVHAFVGNITAKRNEEGDLIVIGKATGPDLDLDQQICDPEWLKSAMPAWMKSGANIREQHSSIAAGVGLELEANGDDWFLKSEVVDPITAKKVEKKVLKGYSIGIKNARVVKDANAPGGRIVSGDIVEISLVDRPANPTARIEIAKAVGDHLELVKMEEEVQIETLPGAKDQNDRYPNAEVCDACHGTGETADTHETCVVCGGSGIENPKDDAQRVNSTVEIPQDNAEAHQEKSVVAPEIPEVEEEVIAEGDTPNMAEALPVDEAKSVEKKDYSDKERASMEESGQAMEGGGFPIKTVQDLRNAIQAIGRAKDRAAAIAHIKERAKKLGREDLIPDSFSKQAEHDEATLNQVRAGLIALIKAELDEMLNGEEDEICDISELVCTLQWFLCWWEDEAEDGEAPMPFATIEEEEEKEGMDMAYIGMGINADLVKAVSSGDTTPEIRDEFRSELIKALGLSDIIANQEEAVRTHEEILKGLKDELASVKEMATAGGPALRQTMHQAQKSADVDRLRSDADRYRKMAEQIIDPATKELYLQKSLTLSQDADRLARN